MKTMLRAGFLLLLLLAIHERILWYRISQASLDPLNAVAGQLSALGLQTSGPDGNGIIQVSAPGCGIAFPVGMFALDGGEDARIAEFLPPNSRPLYIYLGQIRAARQQLHPTTSWLGANLAAMAGMRRTLPPTKLVLAALPATCQHLAALNWGSILE